jgi:hypothetical protein
LAGKRFTIWNFFALVLLICLIIIYFLILL